VEQACFT